MTTVGKWGPVSLGTWEGDLPLKVISLRDEGAEGFVHQPPLVLFPGLLEVMGSLPGTSGQLCLYQLGKPTSTAIHKLMLGGQHNEC